MSYNETTKFCTAEDIIADDWYNILECNVNSSQKDIENSYKKLAKLYHPDKNDSQEAIQKFYKINSAYQILSDKEIRAYYDYESGNANSHNTNFRFQVAEDITFFMDYLNSITHNLIIMQSFSGENLWEHIKTKYIKDKTEFKRKINILGTLDILKSDLEKGIRCAFPLYRYKTCSVCRGFARIGEKREHICYSCEGFGIEEEKIFVYVEVPARYNAKKLLKIPGRGHKIPAGIGDLILRINPVNKIVMRTKMYERLIKNKKIND